MFNKLTKNQLIQIIQHFNLENHIELSLKGKKLTKPQLAKAVSEKLVISDGFIKMKDEYKAPIPKHQIREYYGKELQQKPKKAKKAKTPKKVEVKEIVKEIIKEEQPITMEEWVKSIFNPKSKSKTIKSQR